MGIARAAGSVIESVRRRGFQAQAKADHSLVTEADIAADQVIARALMDMFPSDGWLSEESPSRWGDSGAVWVVDPLDGTDAFVHGGPRGYAVQIARFIDGVLELGVVFEPAVDELFVARRGQGAWVSRRGGPVERVRVSQGLAAARFVCSPRTTEVQRRRLTELGLVDAGAYRSVGVKVGLIASGQAEVYPVTHRVSYWDVAAPLIVLEEAGGRATYLDGRRPSFAFDPPWEMEGPMLLSGLDAEPHAALCARLAAGDGATAG
jgi:3'-phosphoadenosine 5'-phosphosulfate (PAPS) 3'-phosphatase